MDSVFKLRIVFIKFGDGGSMMLMIELRYNNIITFWNLVIKKLETKHGLVIYN